MEPTQTSRKTKVPLFSRGIPWLGGAAFGRSPRPDETTPSSLFSDGQASLIVLSLAFVGLFQGRDITNALIPLVVSILLIGLGVLWLRRYQRVVHPYLRGAAYVLLGMQCLMFLPIYISEFVKR